MSSVRVCWLLSIHDITITSVTLQVASQVMDTLDSEGPRLEAGTDLQQLATHLFSQSQSFCFRSQLVLDAFTKIRTRSHGGIIEGEGYSNGKVIYLCSPMEQPREIGIF